MQSQHSLMAELERPPSKSNLSILSIIQITIMLFIGYDAGSNLFGIFKNGRFSIIDLIKIVVDGLIFLGLILAAYGFFTDDIDKTKGGFLLFFFGLLGLLVIILLGWFKGGFGIGSLLKFLVYLFTDYVIFIQSKHF